jgi:hypothetical protein
MKYIVIRDDFDFITNKFNPNTTNTINIGKLFI